MKKIPALFSYRNCNSVIHRIPCWIKLLSMILLTLSIFHAGIFSTALLLSFTFVIFFLAKTPFSSLFRLRFILWIALFTTLISIFTKHPESLKNDALYIAHFFTTALFTLVVFETTSKIQILSTLSYIEDFLSKILPPFRKLHFALILSITITFIPEIFSAWNKISLSAASRTPLTKKGKRRISIRQLNAQFSALFMNMIQYTEQVRRAVENRLHPSS